MPSIMSKGKGTKADPWLLKTPPGTSEFSAYRDESLTPPALVVTVGKTELRYDLRCIKIFILRSRSTEIGCRWAARTSRSPRSKAQ